jgi:hypothetical protein
MQTLGDSIFAGTAPNANATLTLNNKRVQDTAMVIAQVESRVGRDEVVLSPCALCFEDIPSTRLIPACGRTGCAQLVDKGCLQEWVRKQFHVTLFILIIALLSTGRTRPESSSI